jgi:hypothetical protein
MIGEMGKFRVSVFIAGLGGSFLLKAELTPGAAATSR